MKPGLGDLIQGQICNPVYHWYLAVNPVFIGQKDLVVEQFLWNRTWQHQRTWKNVRKSFGTFGEAHALRIDNPPHKDRRCYPPWNQQQSFTPKNWRQRETVAFPCWVTVRLAGSRFVKRHRGGCFSWQLKKNRSPRHSTAAGDGVGFLSRRNCLMWDGRGNMEHGYKGETWTPHWNLTNKYPKWCHMLKPKVPFFS